MLNAKQKGKHLIYVAGPYTSDPKGNVETAISICHVLMDLGFYPYCPHLSHFMHLQRERPYEDWMELDFEWLKVCDGVLRIPGKSSGADREILLAHEKDIPVFWSIPDIEDYFEERPTRLDRL